MITLPFTSTETTLQNVGGKGANLARLTRAGFNVPRGFIITTDAYRLFVDANNLQKRIGESITGLTADDAARLETASADIRAAFSSGQVSAAADAAIRAAYAELKDAPVAVRSSATAEDLPDLSFAGQQDTYLNVIGAGELIKAVINCWSSLWTARAIGYRIRNNINHDEAALAVVVQEMVQSDVSGVMFTANPLTGLLSESIIEATYGLGEALVSGQVEPDRFVVDAVGGVISSKTLGAKKISTRGKIGGGTETIQENFSSQQTLADDQITQLAALGQQIQKEYGAPQDIEWAFANGKLFLLQSRAITSLFPVPQVSFDPLIVWFSFGAVQGLVGPITPLGRDVIQNMVARAGEMFGVRLDPAQVSVFASSGERLWIKISDVIRHPIGIRLAEEGLGYIEPSVGGIVRSLAADRRLRAGKGNIKLSTMWRVMYFFVPVAARLWLNMLHPDNARARFDSVIADYLNAARIAPADDRFHRLANVVTYLRHDAASVLRFLLPHFIPTLGPSMGALNFLNLIAGENRALALEVTRGLPNNVTTEMDLALWETATRIRSDADSAKLFRGAPAAELARHYLNAALPVAAQTAVSNFMERYGMRGVGEIDFGQPRWREDPAPVMHTLQSYLNISTDFAPDVLFAKGEQAALNAVEKLAADARRSHGGWLKEKMVRAAARRIRLLMGARESPKFFAIRAMGVARKALLEVGQEFVAAETIARADDLVFLNLAELDEVAREKDFTAKTQRAQRSFDQESGKNWKTIITERRAVYEREVRRRQVPRVLVSICPKIS
ncbi:MAG: phosphoenolpyruvate synthase [Chloroflexi bacterium]|nr:phosphoenolpyruvate synthase [Chloroflexota bacterium]